MSPLSRNPRNDRARRVWRALPWAAAAALLALGLLASGCTDGYPSEDAPNVRHMTGAQHLRALNDYLALGATASGTVHRKLVSQDDCHVVLKKRREAGQVQRIVIPLLETSVEIATQPTGSGLRVKLAQHLEDGEREVRLKLDLDRWIDAVAWRSHFQQLQMNCREISEGAAAA
ncbi:hypothetical protein [Variovorax sp. UC122_21]|uniref:hypothetical protein n=1 Tax=Variovorax sp. UC122_21 TaxID=3374554 RepID=UPI003757DD9C